MHPKKLSTISDWPIPSSVKDIQRFLGFANFYRRFISHYASIAAPLYALTQKNSPFLLSTESLNVFEFQKSSFLSAPLLIHHNPSKPVFLYTDVLGFAISGIPHQANDDGHLHLLSFFSQKLISAEINYDVHDKEMLGVIKSLKEFHPWLSGVGGIFV